MMMMMRITRGG